MSRIKRIYPCKKLEGWGKKSGETHRFAKCHGYGVYIRVKNWKVGVKSLGEHTVLQN